MPRKKVLSDRPKLVWRISESAPMGEFIDHDAPKKAASRSEADEVTTASWVESSFDLLHGTDVTEYHDTLTPEALDDLFGDVEGWALTRPTDC